MIIIGIIVSLASIVFGYTLAGGKMVLLWQPSEVIIILGSALGSCIVTNPFSIIQGAVKNLRIFFIKFVPKKLEYINILVFFFNMFRTIRAKGNIEIEKHIEAPEQSNLFTLAPFLLEDSITRNFVVNNFRLLVMGVTQSSTLDILIKKNIAVFKEENENYCSLYSNMGDSLPAIGIIAAVLGVIVAMKNVGESQRILGAKIAAALIGTFLGIFFAYIIISPLGQRLYLQLQQKIQLLHVIRIGLISHINGNSPTVVIEIMRQSVQPDLRPSFAELEQAIQENTLKMK